MNTDDFSRWIREEGLQIVLLALGAILLSRFARWMGDRIGKRILEAADPTAADAEELLRDDRYKHRRTVVLAVERTVVTLIWFIAVFMIMIRLHVPVTSLVAPATVAGVAIGFGAQKIVADLLSGFFLIAEDQFGVGDVVQIAPPGTLAGVTGTVETISLRTTRLRAPTGELIVLPNSEIRQVVNKSRDWSRVDVDVPVDVNVDLDRVEQVLREVAAEFAVDPDWSEVLLEAPSVAGVESIDVGYAHLRIGARTLPSSTTDVARELRRRALTALRNAGFTKVNG